ncbi:MAG: arylsulfatase, partial [Pseudomonadota bacterium]
TSQSFATVKDLTPTLLDLAGVPRPRGLFNGRAVASIEGSSLAPLLSGATNRVHNTDYEVGWELFGRRAMRVGDWKILWLYEPYGEGRWWLFDLASDPAETNDLSRDRPEKLAEMVAAWDRYAAANQAVLPASDAGYGREDPW